MLCMPQLYVKKINQFTIIILLCSTILLTIAIDSCVLFADRHVCTNVEMQGRKWTLLPHAMSTLHYFTDANIMKYGTSRLGHLDYRQRQLTSVKHKLFTGTMTSAKKIVVEFILPNVETSVVSGSTTNESFQLSAQLRLRSNLLPIDSAAQMLKLLS